LVIIGFVATAGFLGVRMPLPGADHASYTSAGWSWLPLLVCPAIAAAALFGLASLHALPARRCDRGAHASGCAHHCAKLTSSAASSPPAVPSRLATIHPPR
jgi:hypothetical protein